MQGVDREIQTFGCKGADRYAVLGPYDFVTVVDAIGQRDLGFTTDGQRYDASGDFDRPAGGSTPEERAARPPLSPPVALQGRASGPVAAGAGRAAGNIPPECCGAGSTTGKQRRGSVISYTAECGCGQAATSLDEERGVGIYRRPHRNAGEAAVSTGGC